MRFDALEIALELIKALRPVVAAVRRGSKAEADQLQDAANSIARNLGEGSGRLGRDRSYHWSVAAGSAREVSVSLRICIAAGWLVDEDLVAVTPLVDRTLAMTWRLTHR